MSPVGMAVIGTGYMGRTYAACLTRHVPDGRLVSVWGGKRAPALAEEFGVEADASLEALLARPDVEAVVITSPHTAHRPQAEAAAAAGKHVYIEKPMRSRSPTATRSSRPATRPASSSRSTS